MNTLHQECFDIWHNYYYYMKGNKYRWSKRDEAHLKNIRVAIADQINSQVREDIIAAFRRFLKSIVDPWILSKLELRLLDTKFNQLWADNIKKFPAYYDQDFEKQLEKDHGMDQVMKYHRYLHSIGYEKLYNMGGTKWVKIT